MRTRLRARQARPADRRPRSREAGSIRRRSSTPIAWVAEGLGSTRESRGGAGGELCLASLRLLASLERLLGALELRESVRAVRSREVGTRVAKVIHVTGTARQRGFRVVRAGGARLDEQESYEGDQGHMASSTHASSRSKSHARAPRRGGREERSHSPPRGQVQVLNGHAMPANRASSPALPGSWTNFTRRGSACVRFSAELGSESAMKRVTKVVALLALAALSLQVAWAVPAHATQVLHAISCCATMCDHHRAPATTAADCCQVANDGTDSQATSSAAKSLQHAPVAPCIAILTPPPAPVGMISTANLAPARSGHAPIFLETRSLRL